MPRTEKPYLLKKSGALSKARTRAGLSQAQAAQELDIRPSSLSNIERGAVQASDELLEGMAELYRIRADELKRKYREDRRAFMVREGI